MYCMYQVCNTNELTYNSRTDSRTGLVITRYIVALMQHGDIRLQNETAVDCSFSYFLVHCSAHFQACHISSVQYPLTLGRDGSSYDRVSRCSTT